jgi:plastocyanin
MSVTTAATAKATRIGRTSAAMAALGLALLVAGCGGSSKSGSETTSSSASTPAATSTSSTSATSTPASSTSASGSTLSLAANPEGQLKYSTTSLSAQAGKVTIDFTNMSPIGHNVTVESSAGKILGATPTFQGGTKTLTLDLKAGTYKFFCSVPGHRMAGMEGTLTVK